jgi:hypothetical protein
MAKTFRSNYSTVSTRNVPDPTIVGFVMRKSPRSKLVGDMREQETKAIVRKVRSGEWEA